MASITHTLQMNWSGSSGTAAKSAAVTLTGQVENNIDDSVPGPTTNKLYTYAFTKAKLQSIYILSDQALTLKTNSSGSPQDTIAIAAGEPWEWYVGSGIANPFVSDVTSLYVSNAGAVAANMSIRTLATS